MEPKEPNKVEGFNSFTGRTIDFTFPVDKSDYLYTKEDLKKAWIHGCIRMPEEFKHLNNFDDWFRNYDPNKHIEHINTHIEELDEAIKNIKNK